VEIVVIFLRAVKAHEKFRIGVGFLQGFLALGLVLLHIPLQEVALLAQGRALHFGGQNRHVGLERLVKARVLVGA